MEDIGSPFPKNRKAESWWLRVARKRFPVLRWAPSYDRESALADLIAGVTLGLTLVPQSIAYAALANLPVQYGLYSAFVGTMLYVLLGTVKEVSIGPTSLMALMTLQTCHGLPIDFVVLLTFLSGCVVLAMGLLKLGFLVDLISPTVTSGFTSATVVIIVASQIKGLLGISFVAENVFDNLRHVYENLHETQLGDCMLGAVCCTILLLLRKLKDVPVNPKRASLKKTLWLISISRNAMVVTAASVLAFCTFDPVTNTHPWFKLSGRVEPGLPSVAAPPFSVASENGTVSFVEMAGRLGFGVLMTPIIMVLANIAIAKAFSVNRVDATQEMVTLGLCNMAGSLFRAMPTCGAFTRSAVSHSSGVRTPLAGLYSGLIALLALAFMTKYFYFIPRACLSSVLICAVIFMFDAAIVSRLWRGARGELAVLALTFAVGVALSVELALLAGALAGLARLLRRLMRPRMHLYAHKSAVGEVARVVPTLALVYMNAEHAAARLAAAAARVRPRPVLLDCSRLSLIDDAAVLVLQRSIKKFKEADQHLILYNASSEVVRRLEGIPDVDKTALRASTISDALACVMPATASTAVFDTAPLLP
ncbi:sodium-independent sulfate anion transporter [Hyposmocoma kahamanoa]|uniref:sodium-independent sulfate anion transporter n=1 Tax=Hyposmocoma kahamanoa TaxID=1477025 RepID=UPI000E6D9C81|nr:sodium-independent sulfate anion transporter [Hyposmocoma kahamanoa]